MNIVRQLGNGGAFNTEMTNTSFTLFDDTVLVDCGYNVFQKLKDNPEIGKKIRIVLITHDHDDHIGSLVSFLYWREFVEVNGDVLVYADTSAASTYIKDIISSGKYVYPSISKPLEHIKFTNNIQDVNIALFEHKVEVYNLTQPTHGHLFNTAYRFVLSHGLDNTRYAITISGDTKANKQLIDFSKKGDYWILFHDISHLNSLENIHATIPEIEQLYTLEDIQHIIPVHTGSPDFKEVWSIHDIEEYIQSFI